MFDAFDAERPGPALEENDISCFERRHGRKVPPSYRSYLLWRNGGTPYRRGWPTYDAVMSPLQWPARESGNDPWTNVSYVYRIQEKDAPFNDLDHILKAKEGIGDIPKNILPVAADAGGNLFFMDLTEGDDPRVLYGPYRELADAAVAGENFIAFLNGLKPESEVF